MKNLQCPTKIKDEDTSRFLMKSVFGSEENRDYMRICIDRAYRDFNRTLHGFSKISGADSLREDGKELVGKCFDKLKSLEIHSQEQFDTWNETSCNSLCSLYHKKGFGEFYIGQAQKWLNMTLKYIYVMGEKRVSGYERFSKFGHIPIDNVIIGKFRKEGAPSLGKSWSKLKDYKKYISYQRWLREKFKGRDPLVVEFYEYLGNDYK
ncbi:MAG: hypothetical protein ACLFP8_09065 [Alphaproteobacteria bacterium]